MSADIEKVIFDFGRCAHEHFPDERRVARGKSARKEVARSRHAEVEIRDRHDPLALLAAQDHGRVQELLPVRYGRMAVSPFTFYRGAAVVMAADLARTPNTGIRTQVCGDAHLMNFGLFDAPDRRLVFDVNDFDETLPGPWEWDVKRLAASLEVAARNRGFSKPQRQTIVTDAVRCYRETMARLAAMGNLEVWYARLDVDSMFAEYARLLTHKEAKLTEKVITKAMGEDSAHALSKLTEVVDGKRRFISQPPLIEPMRELVATQGPEVEAAMTGLLADYARNLSLDRRVLFDQYTFVELARKVVGVGSVGTRCWIALYTGLDREDALVLQIKEAQASVLEPFAGASKHAAHGQRVIAGQFLMQTASDIMLGCGQANVDGQTRDFYVRQLRDGKGSFQVDSMSTKGLSLYGRLCAWTLARAHARAGDRVAIASYLGANDSFDEAISMFAGTYADINERDYDELVQAIRTGRVHAAT